MPSNMASFELISSRLGLVDPHCERSLDIVQQDRDGQISRMWCSSRAGPAKFVPGMRDGEADENAIESLALAYDFFELIQ